MATLDVTRNYADGEVLTEADLDAFLDDVETFLNVTKLNDDNLQNNGITGSLKLLTGSVTATKLASDSVTTVKILDQNVTTAKLADGAVTTVKIDDEAVTQAKLDSAVLSLLQTPPGSIIAYGGTSAPTGWLLCDGSAVSRTTYADLFTAIGEAFGQGDNSTTFNVPDLRGRFLRGVDGSAGRDPDKASRTAMNTGGNTGDAVGSVQGHAFQTHVHSVSDPGHTHVQTYGSTGGGTIYTSASTLGSPANSASATASSTTGVTVGSPSTGTTSTETRPINAGVNFIIKT